MDPSADAGEPERIEAEIRETLQDVGDAVEDWEAMRARLAASIAALERLRPTGANREEMREAVAFLKWLWDNRFAFLGVRRFVYETSPPNGPDRFVPDRSGDLGILRDADRRVVRASYTADGAPSPAVQDFLQSAEPIIIAKANAQSMVHRRSYMDYVGVKTYHPDGTPSGEERFIGLFTAEAYNKPATDIPWLRRKIQNVVEGAQFSPGGHNEKALANILETFPRDEMFQISEQDLSRVSLGVLRLYKRPRTKLFIRRDRFDRFISALVFIPRDQFSSSVRTDVAEILRSAYRGRISAFYPYFGDGPLARVHFIIGLEPDAPDGPPIETLEARIVEAARTWDDDFRDALREYHRGAPPVALRSKYANAFSSAYRAYNNPSDAIADIPRIEALTEAAPYSVRPYRRLGDPQREVRLKLYSLNAPIGLSQFLPVLENMGLTVLQEASSDVAPSEANVCWVHEFRAESQTGGSIDLERTVNAFQDACEAVLYERTENDGFNGLVLSAGLDWRLAAMLRACAKYSSQTGFPFSEPYMAQTLNQHPALSNQLADLFNVRLNPSFSDGAAAREAREDDLRAGFIAALDDVPSLDEDRILRRLADTISAIVRTNFYQMAEGGEAKPYMSFKFDPERISGLPEPRPYREIFVSSPQVDGVHLRFGPIARGGLRWSDRREDYRTEVLDLVKAQQVKNAVITPVGAKGGFFPKKLPRTGDRNAIFAAGRAAYQTFIRGLLDVTDNLIEGAVVRPRSVVARDADDPYLVVAADKGTASFSDTANEIADAYGFWLGDAFASGGSVGYDHKAMGITARGAWEAVKRHFREMGLDTQTEPFRVIGVGDMSGDVFGNGMLLSKQIKLIAAFDHRDIFIDPEPDPAASWNERKRIFDLPRSSWRDYNAELISKGGGIFSRSDKKIPLTDEMRRMVRTEADHLTPAELITALLKADTDLLWMGGIGTYFKGPEEDNLSVGDRANDAIRVNGDACGAKVIGEGANLGLTQLGRIAFARKGGRINTDAIDNSAGVDSSDHEVNIKILLKQAIETNELAGDARNDLLASMTDDVAEHVLRHNYDQTRALSVAAEPGPLDTDVYGRFMSALEAQGDLNRALEYLPGPEALAERRASGEGLSRPELSVLQAYAKIELYNELAPDSAFDDLHYESLLAQYFPKALRDLKGAMSAHRLRREIITTQLANDVVNTCGPTFAFRMHESAGASWTEIAQAFELARNIFETDDYLEMIGALDLKAPSEAQLAVYHDVSELLRCQCQWLLRRGKVAALKEGAKLSEVIGGYQPAVRTIKAEIADWITAAGKKELGASIRELCELGVQEDVARGVAQLEIMNAALFIADLERRTGAPLARCGALFFAIGTELQLDRLRGLAQGLDLPQHFDRLAVRGAVADFGFLQARLTQAALSADPAHDAQEAALPEWTAERIANWRTRHGGPIGRFEDVRSNFDMTTNLGVGKLTLINRQLQELVDSCAGDLSD
ncbi:MAG: NAD-glutamate dehydrogenase [Pseudomonadota bacterium]